VRGKQTGITELKAVKERDPVWIRQLAEQADHFLLAGKTYRNLIARAQRERNSALLAEAESTLKKARDKITVPFLRVEADDALKTHQSLLKAYDDEEKHRVAVISKPAAKWKTKDLAGKTHALADYRGKVVILDFWYRRCAYCLKAMPQVARIAREFKDEPVAVLGVNVDEVETDARFVVDKLKLLYPVLKAGELPTTYEVSAYPTLIVIDQTGKVHSVYEGCVPNLHEEVTKAIRALLTSSGTSPGR